MRVSSLICTILLGSGVLGVHLPKGISGEVGKRKEDCTTSSSSSDSLEPTLSPTSIPSSTSQIITPSLTRTIPTPAPSDKFDTICHCATGNQAVPTEGRWLCGWCGAVSGIPRHGIEVYDTVLCKDNKCRNYGLLDGQCKKAFEEQPPNFGLWCEWPDSSIDPDWPDGTATGIVSGTPTPSGMVTVSVPGEVGKRKEDCTTSSGSSDFLRPTPSLPSTPSLTLTSETTLLASESTSSHRPSTIVTTVIVTWSVPWTNGNLTSATSNLAYTTATPVLPTISSQTSVITNPAAGSNTEACPCDCSSTSSTTRESPTSTATPTLTESSTLTETITSTESVTLTEILTSIETATSTEDPTSTESSTPTDSLTSTEALTSTETLGPTGTSTSTETPTSSETSTWTLSSISTDTPASTSSITHTPTSTEASTWTLTPISSDTPIETPTPTEFPPLQTADSEWWSTLTQISLITFSPVPRPSTATARNGGAIRMNKRAEAVVHPERSDTGWEKRAGPPVGYKRQGPPIEPNATAWTTRARPTVDVNRRQGPHIESSVTCWTCRAQPTADVGKRQGPHIESSVTGWMKRAATTDVVDEDD
ncbi:hypothetical protein DPSP01_008025 [Paraphaeosphaeria sporulosa]